MRYIRTKSIKVRIYLHKRRKLGRLLVIGVTLEINPLATSEIGLLVIGVTLR